MNIAVIGASAGVGLEVVKQLVEAGDFVTTLSRHVKSIPNSPNVRKIKGSALNENDISQAIEGAEAIIIALGTGMSTKATGLYPQASHTLLRVLEKSEKKPPLIVLTGFGAGDSWQHNSYIKRVLFRLFLKNIYAEKTVMEQMISGCYPNAMFVRPGRLTNGERTQRYRVVVTLDESTRIGAISRKDVAHFMVKQAKRPGYIGKYPALSY